MITVTFPTILQLACELTGRVYPPSSEAADTFRVYLRAHLRSVWESYPWPELIEYSQEFFAPQYDEEETYAAGDVVYDTGEEAYYVALRATTGNEPTDEAYWAPALSNPSAPDWDEDTEYGTGDQVTYDSIVYQAMLTTPAGTMPTNTSYWGVVEPFRRTISKTLDRNGDARDENIGEVFLVTQEDPRTTTNPVELSREFYYDDSSVILIRDELTNVWIKFRKAPPTALVDASTIPHRFADIIAHKAAATMLRADGKSDLAAEIDSAGGNALALELDKVTVQEGQVQGLSVYTR